VPEKNTPGNRGLPAIRAIAFSEKARISAVYGVRGGKPLSSLTMTIL
jgi:hypothetical protein